MSEDNRSGSRGGGGRGFSGPRGGGDARRSGQGGGRGGFGRSGGRPSSGGPRRGDGERRPYNSDDRRGGARGSEGRSDRFKPGGDDRRGGRPGSSSSAPGSSGSGYRRDDRGRDDSRGGGRFGAARKDRTDRPRWTDRDREERGRPAGNRERWSSDRSRGDRPASDRPYSAGAGRGRPGERPDRDGGRGGYRQDDRRGFQGRDDRRGPRREDVADRGERGDRWQRDDRGPARSDRPYSGSGRDNDRPRGFRPSADRSNPRPRQDGGRGFRQDRQGGDDRYRRDEGFGGGRQDRGPRDGGERFSRPERGPSDRGGQGRPDRRPDRDGGRDGGRERRPYGERPARDDAAPRDRSGGAPQRGERRGREDRPARGGNSVHQRGRYSEGRTQRGARSADVPAPELPDDVTPGQLDPAAREQLMSLPRSLADVIARHLVMTDRLFEEDPERAYLHARYAQKKASRVGAVREAAGVAAYRIGKWSEALAELRAARRITGDDGYLAVMADCERGLGRPERALELVRSSEGERLDRAEQIELRIVASGARRDLGEFDAAVLELQDEVRGRADKPWSARLFYAYADALLAAGREDEARDWFARSSAADEEGETDADERLAELEGLELVDVDEDVVWSDAEEREPGEAPGPGGPARD